MADKRLHFGNTTKTVLSVLAEGGKPCEARRITGVTVSRITTVIQYLINNGLLVRREIGVYEVTDYGKTYL